MALADHFSSTYISPHEFTWKSWQGFANLDCATDPHVHFQLDVMNPRDCLVRLATFSLRSKNLQVMENLGPVCIPCVSQREDIWFHNTCITIWRICHVYTESSQRLFLYSIEESLFLVRILDMALNARGLKCIAVIQSLTMMLRNLSASDLRPRKRQR